MHFLVVEAFCIYFYSFGHFFPSALRMPFVGIFICSPHTIIFLKLLMCSHSSSFEAFVHICFLFEASLHIVHSFISSEPFACIFTSLRPWEIFSLIQVFFWRIYNIFVLLSACWHIFVDRPSSLMPFAFSCLPLSCFLHIFLTFFEPIRGGGQGLIGRTLSSTSAFNLASYEATMANFIRFSCRVDDKFEISQRTFARKSLQEGRNPGIEKASKENKRLK